MRLLSLAIALAAGLFLSPDASASPSTPSRGVTIHSLVAVEGNPYETAAAGAPVGTLVRQELTAAEEQQPIAFDLELYLQNSDALQTRIDQGDVLTPAQLEKYLPSQATYDALKAWLVDQGFTVTLESNFRHTLFATGTVAQAAQAFQTTFGRVQTSDGEFTSALVEPSLPASLAPAVKAIRGLQPHLRRHHAAVIALTPGAVPSGYLDPGTVAGYYQTPSTLTGVGQTIAIIGDNTPAISDLTQFWSLCGINQSAANFTVVPVQGGPGTDTSDQTELSMDVEWSSSIASGAAIRLYAVPAGLNSYTEAAACTQILNDLPAHPSIHQVSESFGGPEGVTDSSIELLAAQGVTYFSCSGDFGSNPDFTTDKYSASSPLGVEYPASDSNVTGVGGTALVFNFDGQLATPETAWSLGLSDNATGGGLGEGPRPAWQTGLGVPAGTTRCVPDVSAIAYNSTSTVAGLAPFAIVNGSPVGYGGTSLATPIWAGLCAILNQARANAGMVAVGALNPKIYPLIGTGAFNDITTGNNGAYSAGAGYDLCTGIGTPSMANLISALGPPAGLTVTVSTRLPGGAVTNGSSPIILNAVATGNPTSYQWYLNGVAIAGATSAELVLNPTAANEGSYSVVATNAIGSNSAAVGGELDVTTDAWIINLSARAYAETGANQLIAGFVTTGPSNKEVLIRGDGAALAAFSITDFLADPQLTLVNSAGTTLASTVTWSSLLESTFSQVGAFSLAAGSHDTALLESLPAGAYTAQIVSQTTNNGVAMAEIYDADLGAPANRLTNLSARAFVGTGNNVLIGGFVVAGTTPETVIIRADGPALQQFGLDGALMNPVLTLTNGAGTIATNTGWENTPAIGDASTGVIVQPATNLLFAQVGAFLLGDNSGDCAMVVTLPPGSYTAQVAGTNGSTGIALVEIFELR